MSRAIPYLLVRLLLLLMIIFFPDLLIVNATLIEIVIKQQNNRILDFLHTFSLISVKNNAFYEEILQKYFAVCVNSRNFALGNQR